MSVSVSASASAAAPAARPLWPLHLGLGGLILVLFALSLQFGYVDVAPGRVVAAAFGIGDDKLVTIVQDLRLPRTLLALMIGAAMGMSGAVLQGLLRNPLAEPGVLGVTSAAGLGAIVAIYFGLSKMLPYAVPVSAMIGAGVATATLYAIVAAGRSGLTLILAGVAISGLCVALQSLAMNLSPNPWAVNEMVFWLLGSVKDRSFTDVALVAPFIALGTVVLVTAGRALNALTLGEDAALSLGVSLSRVRLAAVVGTSLAVGASVAVAGGIGFIGLVVPHLLRPAVGHLPSRLLVPSALGGAALLLAADMAVRLIQEGPELHLGVVTSLLGAPFFLYLILKTKTGLS
ncbi:iron complex transport system permease protein [Rhodothalassium salexigens DSM 2132]|uniref:Iron complex transport system permease protein n=1 Tax=Rhodothalassium salexigens DSM 2132 TaxID=1188247 RepID=A0A4R2PK20_RHOSA|nr:iron ABC transporter permease [Rhodothalassium salexigens]MBB4211507.1 iron complex transport system permease protein [Rhodothalassium salexigens DSM 2132]MBK1639744.1 ABC transporter permease [Rhodothalassium salexigens DSM 2132]TCP34561.1 iron complex transport system permease protein [Rhodothalassium salexigens DSM 2132]